jgi:hypothetical protein
MGRFTALISGGGVLFRDLLLFLRARLFCGKPGGAHKTALTIAVLYWLGVVAAYAWAAVVRDVSGLAFLPFTFLALPWSILVDFLTEQMRSHGLAAVAYAVICFLLSGVNALIVYWLVLGCSALFAKAVGQKKREAKGTYGE